MSLEKYISGTGKYQVFTCPFCSRKMQRSDVTTDAIFQMWISVHYYGHPGS